MNDGIIGSMKELGVTESYKLKRQVVLSASEAAEMILRYVFFSSSPPHMQMLIIGFHPFSVWTISCVLPHGNERPYNCIRDTNVLAFTYDDSAIEN